MMHMRSAPAALPIGEAEGGKALQAARAADREAAAHWPTAAQKQQQIAELEERAVLFGDPVKQSAQAKVLERKCGFGSCLCMANHTSCRACRSE